ncbi:MAG: glycosyltransferase family 4 protein [Candidatus Competibacteraceae bacterium]
MTISAILLTFLVSFGLTRAFCNPASRLHLLDHPNERSLHSRPIPRSGGVAIMGGLITGGTVAWLFSPYPTSLGFGLALIAVLLVAAVSFLDDRMEIGPGRRLLAHILAAVLLLGAGLQLNPIALPGSILILPDWLAILLSIFFVVWMINLYNFMDGMDGFAGGMAVIGFTSFAILGWQGGSIPFMQTSLLIASAAAGFLCFNFPPAKIFMGDTGSSVLGLLAAALSLWGNRDGLFPLWMAVLIFSPFIVDATVTLLRRLLRGEKIWLPHKTHYYQRLVQLGWGHRKTVLLEYTLMLACSGSALLARHLPGAWQAGLLVTWLLLYSALMVKVKVLEQQTTG